MVITSEIVCQTGTVRGQAKKNNVSIPRKTGKSTIVTHSMIRVNNINLTIRVPPQFILFFQPPQPEPHTYQKKHSLS